MLVRFGGRKGGRAGARLCARRTRGAGRQLWDQRHHIGYATAPPDSTLAAWPYLQGGKGAGHAHAHAHTLMPDGDDCILLVSFWFSDKPPNTPPGKGHDKGVSHPCVLKSVWPDRPG